MKKTDNSARASHFLVHFFTFLHDYDVKLPNATFYGGSKHIEMRSFPSFFKLGQTIWQLNSRKILQHFSSLETWFTALNKVWKIKKNLHLESSLILIPLWFRERPIRPLINTLTEGAHLLDTHFLNTCQDTNAYGCPHLTGAPNDCFL